MFWNRLWQSRQQSNQLQSSKRIKQKQLSQQDQYNACIWQLVHFVPFELEKKLVFVVVIKSIGKSKITRKKKREKEKKREREREKRKREKRIQMKQMLVQEDFGSSFEG